jgi:MYXO-CTERM domain-containing protein
VIKVINITAVPAALTLLVLLLSLFRRRRASA